MVGFLSIIVSIGIVGTFVWIYFKRISIPPKAKLICDVWSIVESAKHDVRIEDQPGENKLF